MPSCTEVALLRLKTASSRKELEGNPTHSSGLETLSSQPGFLSCTWDVLAEDPKMLIWLVEWATMEDHTERFMKIPGYPAFNDQMTTLLDPAKPLDSMTHHFFPTSPAKLRLSSHPTLEVFKFILNDSAEYEQVIGAFQPITNGWTKEARPYAIAKAVDEGQKDRVMFIVGWKSVQEHLEAKKDQAFQNAIQEARKFWRTVALFGHITP